MDIEDLVNSKTASVVDVSRRNDVIANSTQFENFLLALEAGTVSYPNPFLFRGRGGATPPPPSVMVTTSLTPSSVQCLSLWSKDFGNFIRAYYSDRWSTLLRKYTYHFNFTVNSSTAHSRIEPGMESTLQDRLEQLDALVAIAKEQHPDPNVSIGVRCDPIVVYDDLVSGVRVQEIDHFGALLARMEQHGLRVLHISFVSLAWKKIARREKAAGIKFVQFTLAEKEAFIRTNLAPLATQHGVRIGSCAEVPIQGLVEQDGCVSWDNISEIAQYPGTLKTRRNAMSEKLFACHCVVTRDIGTYYPACKHGCLYCYAM